MSLQDFYELIYIFFILFYKDHLFLTSQYNTIVVQ